MLDKLTVGGGATWRSGVSRSDVAMPGGFTDLEQGGYTLVSLMSRYALNDHLSVSAHVDNLFDKRYYEQIGFYSQGWYGEPRNLRLSVRATF